jgi:preprotein translocase subunit YajC
VTSSGVYGTIRSIEGDVVQLEVAPGLELKLAKRAIATMAVPPAPVVDAGSVLDLTTDEPTAADTGDDLNDTPGGPDRPDVAGA